MSAGARSILGGGVALTLILLGFLMTSVGDEGVVHTIQLPATWNSALYTDISGWRHYGRHHEGYFVTPVWPAHPEDVLDRLGPGDRVQVHCRTIWLPNGTHFSTLRVEASGPGGTRTIVASSSPLLKTVFLSTALLPLLVAGWIAHRLDRARSEPK